jgi:hypothetical protein
MSVALSLDMRRMTIMISSAHSLEACYTHDKLLLETEIADNLLKGETQVHLGYRMSMHVTTVLDGIGQPARNPLNWNI